MKNEIGALCRQNFEAFARIILRPSLGDFFMKIVLILDLFFFI